MTYVSSRANTVVMAAALTVAFGGGFSPSLAATFGSGNLTVYRVGDGVAAVGTAANAVFIDEYRPDGTLVQSIPMPVAISGANKPITASNTGSEGLLNRSANGQCLTVPGYAALPGAAGVKASTAATNARAVAFVNAASVVDSSTTLGSTAFSGDAIRSAVSNDCTSVWMGGNGTAATNYGVWYAAQGGSTANLLKATNAQGIAIAAGQLYAAFSSGTLNAVGSGLPTSGTQTITALSGIATKNYRGIAFLDLDASVAGPDTLYLANNSDNTIAKYAYNGSTWTARGTVALTGAHGLVAADMGSGSVMLMATDSTGKLYRLFDYAGNTGTLTGTPTLLVTPGTNTLFYGLAWTPEAALPSAAPQAPTAASYSSLTASGFTANWTAPASGDVPAYYVLELSHDNFATLDKTYFVYGATSQQISNLVTNGTYVFRVRAINSLGGSSNLSYAGSPAITINNSNTPPTFTGLNNNSALSGVIGDATDPVSGTGLSFTVSDSQDTATALTVLATSSNTTVVPNGNISVTAVNGAVVVKITPAAVGYANITVSVQDTGGLSSTRTLLYAASANTAGNANTRWYSGRSDGSTAIPLADGVTLMVGDDEAPVQDASGNAAAGGNALSAYSRAASGGPLVTLIAGAGLDLSNASNCTLPGYTGLYSCSADGEIDTEGSFKLGNRIYWTGSHSNNKSGKSRPDRWRFFATDQSGTEAATSLALVGYYQWLREDLRTWDQGSSHGLGTGYFGMTASSDGNSTQAPENGTLDGFSIEGLSSSPNDAAAWFGFRAPLVSAPGQAAVTAGSATGRTHALIVPVSNFTTLAASSAGGSKEQASFGIPIRLDLGGRGIREIRKNAANQYLIVAGPPDGATGTAPKDFRLYTWDGSTDAVGLATNLRLRDGGLAAITAPNTECSVEGIVLPPANLDLGGSVDVISDCGDANFYGDGTAAKALTYNAWKKFRSDRVTLTALPGAVLSLGTTTTSSQAVTATADQTGSFYWVTLPVAAPVPSFTQIIAGTDAAGITTSLRGSQPVTAATGTNVSVTGLSSATGYVFYGVVVANSVAGNAVTQAFTSAKAAQTLTFGTAPATLQAGGASGVLAATTTAVGVAVTFSSITPTLCTVSGSTVTPKAAGMCTVAADQAGNASYNAAAQVRKSFTITPASTATTGVSPAGTGDVTATFTTGGGASACGYATSAFKPVSAVPITPPTGVRFPQGVFEFVTNAACGATTLNFTITYPQALPANAKYYKFGPESSNLTPHWYVLAGAVITTTATGSQVTFSITDNGVGDADATVGVIADPGGPGVPDADASVTSVPTLGEWGMLLLVGLMGLFGMQASRGRLGRR